jgi:hypothetical protein
MRLKTKEIVVNLPVVLTFDNRDEIAQLAAGFNTFVAGKVKMKYEELGILNEKYIGLFYLQRDSDSQELRDNFMKMIEDSEMSNS